MNDRDRRQVDPPNKVFLFGLAPFTKSFADSVAPIAFPTDFAGARLLDESVDRGLIEIVWIEQLVRLIERDDLDEFAAIEQDEERLHSRQARIVDQNPAVVSVHLALTIDDVGYKRDCRGTGFARVSPWNFFDQALERSAPLAIVPDLRFVARLGFAAAHDVQCPPSDRHSGQSSGFALMSRNSFVVACPVPAPGPWGHGVFYRRAR
jgi:hypothetical protein